MAAAAARVPRVLDVPELQIVVHYLGDPNVHWHHRVLLRRTSEANWLALTPDGDIQREDLSQLDYRILNRGGAFPADIINDLYVFDPIDQATPDGYRRQARLQAQVLGADVGEEAEGEL